MKRFAILLAGASVYAGNLIFLSGDITASNLQTLSTKYQQVLVVDDHGVYLVPGECKVERYFGGASEGLLNLVKGPMQTQTVLNTQEVFEAKEEQQIVKKIDSDKAYLIAEGKISKDFLEDKEGRGFGGASEVALIIRNEIEVTKPKESVIAPLQSITRPACQLLRDGSGYKIDSLSNGKLYINGKMNALHNNTVLFE